MKHSNLLVILVSIFLFSCNDNYSESKYYMEKYSIIIIRQDWNNCMTKLSYIDKNGKEIGSALFYYPGRDGWFLVDNIWGDNCVYLVLRDACPKLIIKDSSQFIIEHDDLNIQVGKSNWRRVSSIDEAPVVQRKNEEYETSVVKLQLKGECNSKMPDWENYPGKYYKF